MCLGRQGNEFMVALFLQLVRAALARDWTPRRVVFAHPPPPALALLEAHFRGARLEFGASLNALVFPPEDLELRLASSDGALLEVLDHVATEQLATRPRRPDLLTRVRQRLRDLLGEGTPRLPSLARRLRMSPRTLQRRLTLERTTFDELITDVRRELALSLLANPRLPLSEVSFRLGYSDASAFTRAFTRWTGTPPSDYRARFDEQRSPPSRRSRK